MNFLAHLHLANHHCPESLIGNIMPDLIRGKLPDDLTPKLQAGVTLHRKVDGFTDMHPDFLKSKDRIRDNHGIFSGILIDIFYDHFLAANFKDYHDHTLPHFIKHVYKQFAIGQQHIPSTMKPIIERLKDQDWLTTYATIDGIQLTLTRMSERYEERFSREVKLQSAIPDLEKHYKSLQKDFKEFYPKLQQFVRVSRALTFDPRANRRPLPTPPAPQTPQKKGQDDVVYTISPEAS
ncbi:ACP phosphodiesterase [Poriferisphaera sp. WC338]|uniref:acyl carrier protein phosphodiesterase n=1 Tax=Poriferisphaera sp. WC338 TaxID=3425129 RepID=UPI003D81BB5E